LGNLLTDNAQRGGLAVNQYLDVLG
jgi:hypothetical protein